MTTELTCGCEAFRLVVASAFYHPDRALRDGLRTALDAWLKPRKPMSDAEMIRDILASERGTAIEPFVLADEDIDCAIFLTRAAFAAKSDLTRVRIVSKETIGDEGGLVLTRNLGRFYVERYALGKYRKLQHAGLAFVPSLIPDWSKVRPSHFNALLTTDEDGFRVTVPLAEAKIDPALLARKYQTHGRIEDSEPGLSRHGLRVECTDGQVQVMSGSPESMIRLMAYMVRESTLLLRGSGDSAEIPEVRIRLAEPTEEPKRLWALISSTPTYSSWIRGDLQGDLSLTTGQVAGIAEWLRPDPRWIERLMKVDP